MLKSSKMIISSYIVIIFAMFLSMFVLKNNIQTETNTIQINNCSFSSKPQKNYGKIKYNSFEENNNRIIEIKPQGKIIRYSIIMNNFDDLEISNKRTSLKIKVTANNYKEYEFAIKIETNKETKTYNFYGINDIYGLLINNKSIQLLYEQKNKMAFKNGEIGENDFYDFYRNKNIVEETNIYSLNKSAIYSENEQGNTFIEGKIRWIDRNGKYQPLRYVKIGIEDYNSNGNIILGYTYTDIYGNYSFSFNNNSLNNENDGYDLFITIYAEGKYISVGNTNGTGNIDNYQVYKHSTDMQANMNVATGSTTVIDVDFSLASELSQALQITQPLNLGAMYYENMQESSPMIVKCSYDTSFDNDFDYDIRAYYNRRNFCIYLEEIFTTEENMPNMYESWDIILHEYGHHVQNILNFNNSIGGYHNFGNMIDEYISNPSLGVSFENAYNEGCNIAWTEGWATAFAFIVQSYFNIQTHSIPFSDRYTYNDPDFSLNLKEEASQLNETGGEGNEMSIAAFLISLIDASYIDLDESILSNVDWWDYTTNNTNFNNFITQLYEQGNLRELTSTGLSRFGITSKLNNAYFNDILNDAQIEYNKLVLNWIVTGGLNYPNDNFKIIVYSEDKKDSLEMISITSGNFEITNINTILEWTGSKVYLRILSKSTNTPLNIYLWSELYEIEKPTYKFEIYHDYANIMGSYYKLSGYITLPSEFYFNGVKTVLSIKEESFLNNLDLISITMPENCYSVQKSAFENCNNLTYLTLNSVESIGNGAFKNCDFFRVTFSNNLEIIGNEAFYNSGTISKIPKTVIRIGDYAFYNCDIKDLILTSTTNNIGAHAFKDCNNTTFYIEQESRPTNWNLQWNSSNRPVIWGCTLSSDKSYVISINTNNLNNANAVNGIVNPTRDDYTFGGWYTTLNFTGTQYMDLSTAPTGILYAKWNSSSSSCIVEGTKITLADGSLINVEELEGDEELLVWDMFNGCYSTAPILFIDREELNTYNVINLVFSDGTINKIVSDHGFFDMTLNKYIYIKEDNYLDYVGHYFNKGDNEVQLLQAYIQQEFTKVYSPVTYGHLCYYVNGMLSMPGNTESFANIFDIDNNTLTYINMNEDIEEYGLYTYEEFNSIIELSEYVFNAFNGQYLKIAIGKGITTLEEIQILLDRYMIMLIRE